MSHVTIANSLTVTNAPWLEFLHLNFGYHVEHHFFPTISGVHTKKIHVLLKKHFGADLKVMPKWDAITAIYKTARIYKSSTMLTNPETGATYPTI